MDTMTWEKREDDYECPWCGVEGYEAVFWLCCDKAEAEFAAKITGPFPPTYVILPLSIRELVKEVDWLSLKEVS